MGFEFHVAQTKQRWSEKNCRSCGAVASGVQKSGSLRQLSTLLKKMKICDWGGDRYHREEPCTAVAGTSHVSGQCVLADGSQKRLPPAEIETIRKLPKLKGYDIVSRLGGGAYGDVYKAKLKVKPKGDDEDGQIIAVKVQNKKVQTATKARGKSRVIFDARDEASYGDAVARMA